VLLTYIAIKNLDLVLAMIDGDPGSATEVPSTFMCRITSGPTTSYVRGLVLLKASGPGASGRLDALKKVTRAGSAVKKWPYP
jgi:hypothetical protein